MHKLLIGLSLAILLGSSLVAAEVMRDQLPNGMTLIVHEDHLTPSVSIVLAVQAAPWYEEELLGSGASELLRRLKIQSRSPALEALIQESGHRIDGYTNQRYTIYTIETTQEHLESSLKALGGVVANRDYNQAAFDRQRQSLLSAQQLRDQSIDHHIRMGLQKAFYRQAAQSVPAAGESLPLLRLSLEAVQRYDQSRYVSGNMTLIVNGNVATGSVKKLARQVFTVVPQGFVADWVAQEEPEMLSSRTIAIEQNDVEPELILAWRTERMSHQNQAILSLMAAYLNAPNSPLREALRNQQIATSLSVNNETHIGAPGYFQIRIGLRSEETQKALSAVGSVLADLQENKIDDTILHQMHKQLHREALVKRHDTMAFADQMLRWEMEAGVPLYGSEIMSISRKIRPAHVQKAAQRYFRSSQSCKLVVRAPPIETVNGDQAVVTRPLTSAPPMLETLDNGVRVIERPMPLGLTHIVLSLGIPASEERLNGINQLLARMVTRRTSLRSAEDLNRLLAQQGMQLTAQSVSNAIQLQITCFPEDTLPAIGILADCVTRPNFQEADLEYYRQQLLDSLAVKAGEKQWYERMRRRTLDVLFEQHYVSSTQDIRSEQVKDINVKVMHDYLRRLVQGPNVVLSIYGSYDQKKTAAFLKQHISNARLFPRGERLQPIGTAWSAFQSRSGSMTGSRDALAISWRAPATSDPLKDRVAMDVLIALLAGANGRGGVVGDALAAQDRDLFIESAMRLEHYDKRGVWMLMVRVDPEHKARVRDLLTTAIQQGCADLFKPLNDDFESRLQRAREICRTNFLLTENDQQHAAASHALTVLRYDHLDSINEYQDHLQHITIADLQRLAQQYLDSPSFILIKGGDSEDAATDTGERR